MTNFHTFNQFDVRRLSLKSLLVVIIGIGVFFNKGVWAQDPARFAVEVSGFLAEEPMEHSGDLIIFTGSSSIRGWKNLKADFSRDNVLNRGFGGSQMSDLLAYVDGLVIKHKPSVVFIYEGDNDIAAGESPDDILTEAKQVTELLRTKLPDIEIVFISAKPSISRWHLKTQYIRFNAALNEYAITDRSVHYADVWTPMLNSDGSLNRAIFIEDGLHMNLQGYEIWTQAIEPILSRFRRSD